MRKENNNIIREREFNRLISIFNLFSGGEYYFAAIFGYTGSGKSRIVEEFKIYAQINFNRHFLQYEVNGGDKIFCIDFFKSIVNDFEKISNSDKKDFFEIENNVKKLDYLFKNNYEIGDNRDEKVAIIKNIATLCNHLVSEKGIIIHIDKFERIALVSSFIFTEMINAFHDFGRIFIILSIDQSSYRGNLFNKDSELGKSEKYMAKIVIKNLTIKQVRKLVISEYPNPINIPFDFYYNLFKVAGQNIKRIIAILDYLYKENVIVKNLNGFYLKSYHIFQEKLEEYSKKYILSKLKNLNSDELYILKILSLSITELSIAQLSKISNIDSSKIRDYLARLFSVYYIKIKSIKNTITYLIDEPMTIQIIRKLTENDERKDIFSKFIAVIFKNDCKNQNKKFIRYIYTYITSKRRAEGVGYKLSILKKGFIKKNNLMKYIDLNNYILNNVSELEIIDKIQIIFDIIVTIFRYNLSYDQKYYIQRFFYYISKIDDIDKVKYEIDVIQVIHSSVGNEVDDLEKIITDMLDYYYDNVEYKRTIIDVSIYTIHILYENKQEMVSVENLLNIINSSEDFKAEYNYLKLFKKLTSLCKKENISNNLNKEIEIFKPYFEVIKKNGSLFLISIMHLDICQFLATADYDDEIELFFNEAIDFADTNNYFSMLYRVKFNFSNYLKYNFRYVKSLKILNSIFTLNIDFNYYDLLMKIKYYKELLRFKLEDFSVDIVNNLLFLAEYFSTKNPDLYIDSIANIIKIYESCANFQKREEFLNKVIDEMIKSENITQILLRFYLEQQLKYFSPQEILDKISNIFVYTTIRIQGVVLMMTEISRKKEIKNEQITNEYIIQYLTSLNENSDVPPLKNYIENNNLIFIEERILLIDLIVKNEYNKSTIIKLHENLLRLYERGYKNYAEQITVLMAEFFYENNYDISYFLLFTESAYKINGDIYYNSLPQYRKFMRNERLQGLDEKIGKIKKNKNT